MSPETSTTTDPGSTGHSRARSAVTILVALALVAGLVWLVLGLVDRLGEDSAAESRQGDRDAVMLRSREYVDAAWNYGPSGLDEQNKLTDYRERVTPLITTSFGTEFEKSAPVLDQLVAQQEFARSTTVDHVGVQSIDADSAEVIVNGRIEETQGGKAVRPTPFFWLLDLEKVDGTWLVSDLNGFGGDQ